MKKPVQSVLERPSDRGGFLHRYPDEQHGTTRTAASEFNEW